MSTDVTAADLSEILAIRQLKARYCRLLDAKDWQGWRGVFADEFVMDLSQAGGAVVQGGDAFVAYTRKNVGKPSQITVHQVHAPEIELTSATTAQGVWALNDIVRFAPGLTMNGYGHYQETYEKRDGTWLIMSSKLTRLRDDLVTPFFSMCISDRMRNAGGRFARSRPPAKKALYRLPVGKSAGKPESPATGREGFCRGLEPPNPAAR